MANDRLQMGFQRTLQVVGYEPIVYFGHYETDVKPGETVQDARDRCHLEAAASFTQVQEEVIAVFGCGPQVELSGPPTRPTTNPKSKKPPTKRRGG